MHIFERELIIVTGKGGVGKTTVSIVLALMAVKRGLRVCLVEMDQMSSLSSNLGLEAKSYTELEITPGLTTLSLAPLACANEFGAKKLRINALAKLIFQNRLTAAFFDAIPGLNDLLQLGKIEDLVAGPDARYDLVILDAPATGHGLTLLSSASSMAEMTRIGPFYELARSISELLSNPDRTALVICTLPELLPVHESIDLCESLSAQGMTPQLLVVNQSCSMSLPPNAEELMQNMRSEPGWSEVASCVQDAAQRARSQAEVTECLNTLSPGLRTLNLPKLPGGRLKTSAFQRLASTLEGDAS